MFEFCIIAAHQSFFSDVDSVAFDEQSEKSVVKRFIKCLPIIDIFNVRNNLFHRFLVMKLMKFHQYLISFQHNLPA
jgi:hypothetical protein